jgi:hypothetical protein
MFLPIPMRLMSERRHPGVEATDSKGAKNTLCGLFQGARKIAVGVNRALVAASRAHGLLHGKDALAKSGSVVDLFHCRAHCLSRQVVWVKRNAKAQLGASRSGKGLRRLHPCLMSGCQVGLLDEPARQRLLYLLLIYPS